MNAITLASRAVLTEYATKVLRPVEWAAIGIFVVCFIGTILLAVYASAWWWLLMVVVIAYGIIGSIAWLVIHFTIDSLRPEQTGGQKAAVASFIASAEKIADALHITRFGLILRIIRDVMGRNRANNLLTEFMHASKDLRSEFGQLVKAFTE